MPISLPYFQQSYEHLLARWCGLYLKTISPTVIFSTMYRSLKHTLYAKYSESMCMLDLLYMCTIEVWIFNEQRDTIVQNLPKVHISQISYAVNHNCILKNFLRKAYDPKLNIGVHMFTVLDTNTRWLTNCLYYMR